MGEDRYQPLRRPLSRKRPPRGERPHRPGHGTRPLPQPPPGDPIDDLTPEEVDQELHALLTPLREPPVLGPAALEHLLTELKTEVALNGPAEPLDPAEPMDPTQPMARPNGRFGRSPNGGFTGGWVAIAAAVAAIAVGIVALQAFLLESDNPAPSDSADAGEAISQLGEDSIPISSLGPAEDGGMVEIEPDDIDDEPDDDPTRPDDEATGPDDNVWPDDDDEDTDPPDEPEVGDPLGDDPPETGDPDSTQRWPGAETESGFLTYVTNALDACNASVGRHGQSITVNGTTYLIQEVEALGSTRTDSAGRPMYAGFSNEANELLLGTPDDDHIEGLGGDDLICSFGGDDYITGGPGHDILIAGEGLDISLADHGPDGQDLIWADEEDFNLPREQGFPTWGDPPNRNELDPDEMQDDYCLPWKGGNLSDSVGCMRPTQD